jgi:glyoxylase-like metal-dependent hydrolase (beta-lactamase superfamily II)
MTTIPYGGETVRVGDLEVMPVFDGYSKEDPTHFYITRADMPRERGHSIDDWSAYPEFLDDNKLIEHGLGGFLVRTGDHLVLIDAGVGPNQIGPYGPFNRVIAGGELPARLRELGVDPMDITDIVLTHLHPDHFGWATFDGGALFPNATIRCHVADWEHFVVAPGAAITGFAAQLPSIATRIETWHDDGPLFPGIDTRLAPGHTPGSTILVLSSGDARALLLGDVVHCPVELIDDEWASLGDVDPALARRTKVALARELEGTDIPSVAAHFPGMRFGRLLPGEGRRHWVV